MEMNPKKPHEHMTTAELEEAARLHVEQTKKLLDEIARRRAEEKKNNPAPKKTP